MQVPQGWKTTDFRHALLSKRFVQAETWLRYVREHRPQFPQYIDSWFGDRERELFDALYQHAGATGATAYYGHAKRIANWSLNEDHKEPRARRLAEVAGIDYDQIPELPFTG